MKRQNPLTDAFNKLAAEDPERVKRQILGVFADMRQARGGKTQRQELDEFKTKGTDAYIDLKILEALKAGKTSRADLMAIEDLRLMTWARVNERLTVLCKHGMVVELKTGWRLIAK